MNKISGYFDFDGSIDKLYSKLPDTIKNRKVSYELVEELNAFIDEFISVEGDEFESKW